MRCGATVAVGLGRRQLAGGGRQTLGVVLLLGSAPTLLLQPWLLLLILAAGRLRGATSIDDVD